MADLSGGMMNLRKLPFRPTASLYRTPFAGCSSAGRLRYRAAAFMEWPAFTQKNGFAVSGQQASLIRPRVAAEDRRLGRAIEFRGDYFA
jgi:hypothetical protein